VVQANWRDNDWFTKELDDERRLDLALYPERYDHIWEGDYARAFDGAYEIRIDTIYNNPSKPVTRLTLETITHEGTDVGMI